MKGFFKLQYFPVSHITHASNDSVNISSNNLNVQTIQNVEELPMKSLAKIGNMKSPSPKYEKLGIHSLHAFHEENWTSERWPRHKALKK